MNFFNPDSEAPNSAIEILMVPLFFLFAALFAYTVANRYFEAEGKKPKWFPAVWVLLGLAVLFGLQRFMFTFDILYAQTLVTGRIRYSHHLGLILPIVTCIIIAIKEFNRKRADSERLY